MRLDVRAHEKITGTHENTTQCSSAWVWDDASELGTVLRETLQTQTGNYRIHLDAKISERERELTP